VVAALAHDASSQRASVPWGTLARVGHAVGVIHRGLGLSTDFRCLLIPITRGRQLA
jgi:hypothetical protein